jgi:peptidoglycan/xylan/chitin deacetylase (PgdA/CDA1 family)
MRINREKVRPYLFIRLAVAAAFLAALLWFALPPSEPKYKGVTLSRWLERYGYEVDADQERNEAAEAVRHIGPKAIPFLLKWAEATDSGLKRKLEELADKQSFVRLNFTTSEMCHERAILGFQILSSAGKPAIPQLQRQLFETNSPEIAAAILFSIGPDATPSFISGLTNAVSEIREQTAYCSALSFLAAIRRDPPIDLNLPMNLLTRLLEDSNHTIRLAALVQLAYGTKTHLAYPETVVPLLIRELDNNHYPYAIDALKRYGSSAKAAVPALIAAANANPGTSDIILDALERIDPEAAARLLDLEFSEGGIIRGPKTEKRIALVFTAHTFAEGGDVILNELAKHHAKASFFVTGDFLDNPQFRPLAKRIVADGHYIGPHSDKHLLYCSWDNRNKTLVTREEFETDLNRNLDKIVRLDVPREQIRYWLPAYEYYNREIVDWSKAMGLTLVNYTPGTRSNADYLEDTAKNYISSEAILESIRKKEQTDPNGLNGFLLLMHLGVGPARSDKLYDHLGELLDYLSGKGYQFVRVDELLNSK